MEESCGLAGAHLCFECGSTFRSRQGIRKHINTKHIKSLKYKCDACQKEFTEKHQLRAHLVQHGGAAITCNVYNKHYSTNFALKRHMTGAHEHVKFTCWTCQKVFADEDVLKEHVSALHRQQYRYVCDAEFCGAKYRWRTSLARHIKSKHTET